MNVCQSRDEIGVAYTDRPSSTRDPGEELVSPVTPVPTSTTAPHTPAQTELMTVGRAACGLVHDMRNLAFSMRAVLDRMARGSNSETWDEDVQTMTACVDYLQSLADNVSRLAEPLKSAHRKSERTSLRQWWAQAQKVMKLVAPRRVALDCSLNQSDLWISLDSNSFTHVMLNLIHNAAKALQGREDGRISIWATRDERGVHINISDNGPGLPPQIARELCERQDAAAASSSPAGAGQEPPATQQSQAVRVGHGLGIVRDIVLGCGGELRVRSAANVGTTLTLVLPGGTLDQQQP